MLISLTKMFSKFLKICFLLVIKNMNSIALTVVPLLRDVTNNAIRTCPTRGHVGSRRVKIHIDSMKQTTS